MAPSTTSSSRRAKAGLLCVLLLLPVGVLAQFKCTMPSGIVIFNRLSTCPPDAVKSEPLDRVPDSVQPQFKGEYREPPPPGPNRPAIPWPAQAAPAQARPSPPPVTPAKSVERDIISEAYAICALLKVGGATTCEVDVNVFAASVIDATVATTPNDAQKSCLVIANMTRQPGSPFVGRGWQLKLFSPLGAGTRPMAQCAL